MKPLAFAFVALFLCAGCRPPGQPSEADIELKPEQVRDFAVLYSENCAGCHGKDGKGNGAFALANPVYLAIASEETLRRGTSLGVPGRLMPAFAKSAGGTLTDDQIDILVREIRSRWAKPSELGASPPPYAAEALGNAQRAPAFMQLSAPDATDRMEKVLRKEVPLSMIPFSPL